MEGFKIDLKTFWACYMPNQYCATVRMQLLSYFWSKKCLGYIPLTVMSPIYNTTWLYMISHLVCFFLLCTLHITTTTKVTITKSNTTPNVTVVAAITDEDKPSESSSELLEPSEPGKSLELPELSSESLSAFKKVQTSLLADCCRSIHTYTLACHAWSMIISTQNRQAV